MLDLLGMLSEEGDRNEFHDGYEGWLSWAVSGDTLTVLFQPWDERSGGPGLSITQRWQLVPV